jgi:hypothetical protein
LKKPFDDVVRSTSWNNHFLAVCLVHFHKVRNAEASDDGSRPSYCRVGPARRIFKIPTDRWFPGYREIYLGRAGKIPTANHLTPSDHCVFPASDTVSTVQLSRDLFDQSHHLWSFRILRTGKRGLLLFKCRFS